MLSTVTSAVNATAPAAAGAGAPVPGQGGGIQREPNPDLAEKVKNNISALTKEVKADKAHWKDAFERMRYDVKFAAGKNQWPNQRKKESRYIANITGRHINQRVASVYAKNPTFVAKRRERLKYKLWDGNPQSYQAAQQMVAQYQMQAQTVPPDQLGNLPAPQGAQALITEVGNVATMDQQLDRMGDTARLLLSYYVKEQEPSFKKNMKRVVRRAKTMGVGYVRMGFQRVNQTLNAADEQGLIDSQRRLEFIEQKRADLQDGKIDEYCAEAEQLEQSVKALLAKKEIVLREGLIWDFPDPLHVIPDRNTAQLDGFVGAKRVTVEHVMDLDRVKQLYKKDIGGNYKSYTQTKDGKLIERSGPDDASSSKNPSYALVWEIYDRPSGVMYTIADGHNEYLVEPSPPDVDLERYFPIYTYITSESEDEDIFPVSDVRLIEPIQVEYNRRREAERQHRIANRPLYAAPKGALVRSSEEGADDIKTLANHPAHGVVEVQGIAPGQKIGDVLAALEKVPIDPKVYETETLFSDSQRVVGSQDVDYGGVSGATATEVGVADAKRLTSEQEDVDSLDMLLSEIARDGAKIMLTEVSQQTAINLVGPGAVWPTLSRQQVAEELYLDIEAGSSGRPNQAQEVNKLQQIAPTVQATPGINPTWWAKKVVKTIDPAVDLSEAVTEGLPAMIVLNQKTQPNTEQPGQNPDEQGAQGGNNAVNPPGARPVPAPTFPTAQAPA